METEADPEMQAHLLRVTSDPHPGAEAEATTASWAAAIAGDRASWVNLWPVPVGRLALVQLSQIAIFRQVKRETADPDERMKAIFRAAPALAEANNVEDLRTRNGVSLRRAKADPVRHRVPLPLNAGLPEDSYIGVVMSQGFSGGIAWLFGRVDLIDHPVQIWSFGTFYTCVMGRSNDSAAKALKQLQLKYQTRFTTMRTDKGGRRRGSTKHDYANLAKREEEFISRRLRNDKYCFPQAIRVKDVRAGLGNISPSTFSNACRDRDNPIEDVGKLAERILTELKRQGIR